MVTPHTDTRFNKFTFHDPFILFNRRDRVGATNEHMVTRCQHPARVGLLHLREANLGSVCAQLFDMSTCLYWQGTRQFLDSSCRKQSSRVLKDVCGTKSGLSELGRSLRQEPSSSTRPSHCERRN
jgi:hypothetical protein